MELSVSVEIGRPNQEVWNAIVDFENCSSYIKSILKVEILEKPAGTLVGFKWKETRVMFGKEATETMWITDYKEHQFYQTRAESHGSVYISRLSTKSIGDSTAVTMSFQGLPQTTVGKVMTFCLGFLMKGTMKKALLKDLNDIKLHLEKRYFPSEIIFTKGFCHIKST